MSQVHAYAAHAEDAPLVPLTIERRALRDDDVAIDIHYCGVCHSDLHVAYNDWGSTRYPIVPGHEIVGKVTAVGKNVTRVAVGDAVGVGCMVDSCGSCAACHDGVEQYCLNGVTMTYGSDDRIDGTKTQGGYSSAIVTREDFVLTMPEGIELASAAPLLCAGITTYSPLRHHGVGKGHKVGVIGMGGLGHMGVKLARALGAEVTLFTRSEAKVEEARRNGAHHVVVSTDEAQMEAVAETFDFMLDTVPVAHDINPYLDALKYDGTHILVGLIEPVEPAIHGARLIGKRRAVAGSLIGGIAETQEMLDFCAAQKITCDVEMLDIKHINEAYARMQKGDVRYRFVIDMATLDA
ncbi:NAD(P)-dependent alcohol dehydrogenase [Halomonas cibimaris]|uniref:NAD(P)-dependent alcohol dehydrogenase n=1 Tax=Halomonas cibimaris TaxID=657012 RepID=A0ABP7L8M2_9GAMM